MLPPPCCWLMPPSPQRPPTSPLADAIGALDALTGDERLRFYESLDQLGNVGSPTPTDAGKYTYTIDEEDWQWLATAVGTKSQQDLIQFAHDEHERMVLEDPDLVRHGMPGPQNGSALSLLSLFPLASTGQRARPG